MTSFDQARYLADLLEYARMRIQFSTGSAVPSAGEVAHAFEDAFGQPIGPLSDPANQKASERPVGQARIAVEVLRGFAAPLGIDTAAADADYTWSAYTGLLAALGASYEELRLARDSADDPDGARRSLADQLALDQVERVDQLFMVPGQVTQAGLEELFGLRAIGSDPFGDDPAAPLVTVWRLDRLRASWQQHPSVSVDGMDLPVIDPDLVSEDLLIDPDHPAGVAAVGSSVVDDTARKAAGQLLSARVQEIADLAGQVSAAITQARTGATALEAFDAVIGQLVGNVVLETALAARTESSPDPNEAANQALAALDLTALRRLVRLRRLAHAQTVTEAEWADLASILVGLLKRGRYAGWRQEEAQAGVFVGPDFFALPTAAAPTRLPAWRASRRQRVTWQDLLRARSGQAATIMQGVRDAVAATQSPAMIRLRDALVTAIGLQLDPAIRPDVGDLLTRRLLLDVSSDDQDTTRVSQAVSTIQGVFFGLRAGSTFGADLPGANPAPQWQLRLGTATTEVTEEEFDAEWHWMGSYPTRLAAEFVKDHPENYLLPSLRDRDRDALWRPTAAFWGLIGQLRSQPQLSRAQARQMVNQGFGEPTGDNPRIGYLAALRQELAGASGDDATLPTGPTKQDGLDDYVITEQFLPAEQRWSLPRNLFNGLHVKTRTYDPGTGPITIEDPHLAPNWFQEIFYFVPMAIAIQLQRSGEYLAALDWYQAVYDYQQPPARRKVYPGLEMESVFADIPGITFGVWLREELNPHFFARERKNAYTRFTIISIAQCLLDFADSEFTTASDESLARARALYLTALDQLNLDEIPADNPIADTLLRHARLNLDKLRHGRDISGLQRPAPQPSAAPAAGTVPVVSGSGQLVVPAAAPPHPTPYRYSALIDRAKQLVTLAQQMEASYLSTLEKQDAETYTLLRAIQDLRLSAATIELQKLQVGEADTGVSVATLQHERVEIQLDTYQDWIDAGLNRWEQSTINSLRTARDAREAAAEWGAAAVAAQAFAAAAGPGGSYTWAGAASTAAWEQAGASIEASSADTAAQIASIQASQERRKQEWELQHSLAEQDTAIAEQQITAAVQHRQVIEQELQIAQARADDAKAAVDFLSNKFTNADLYEWMGGVLARVYSYFLQQATAMARLAQSQLAFERQQPATTFIKADYWQPTPPNGAAPGASNQQPDRRGLTGSARLLQDIYTLDQYAFDTDQRKLQLSQSFSLAQLAPFEFEQFRLTGVLPFATPMDLFDHGFPGHYLRLIKQVRTSVVALIPPLRGIRATLTASGVSRVVTADPFQTTQVRRSPESVALTAPANATGVFDLQPTSGMRLPFESIGVDTQWELRMPRPANPFDYATIADVVVTIDYTALDSEDYRRTVLTRLDNRVSGDRSYSVRDDFQDGWYDLHQPPDDPQSPVTIQLRTRTQDFPPNLEDPQLAQLLLFFTRTDPASDEVAVDGLTLTRDDGAVSAGAATTIDGVISTRRANGASWLPLTGGPPTAQWQLQLPASTATRIRNEDITDILLVISYTGRTPDWPL